MKANKPGWRDRAWFPPALLRAVPLPADQQWEGMEMVWQALPLERFDLKERHLLLGGSDRRPHSSVVTGSCHRLRGIVSLPNNQRNQAQGELFGPLPTGIVGCVHRYNQINVIGDPQWPVRNGEAELE